MPLDPSLGDDAVRICQALLRIDTTNPPGRERAAADLLAGELADTGREPRVLESAPTHRAIYDFARVGLGKPHAHLPVPVLGMVQQTSCSWASRPAAHAVLQWPNARRDLRRLPARLRRARGRSRVTPC